LYKNNIFLRYTLLIFLKHKIKRLATIFGFVLNSFVQLLYKQVEKYGN